MKVATAATNAPAMAAVPTRPMTRSDIARWPSAMTIVPASGKSRMSQALVCI